MQSGFTPASTKRQTPPSIRGKAVIKQGLKTPSNTPVVIAPTSIAPVFPALANEFIVLLKETSVAGYVTIRDLTMGGNIIRAATYSPFMPLIAVAIIYLVLVMFFTKLVNILERRLRKSER